MSNSNFWQLVFNQSRVNGAEYYGERLPINSWDWPKNTFLQKRLNELKKSRPDLTNETRQANREPIPSRNRRRRHTHHEQPNWLHSAQASTNIEGH